ncbi:MAG: TM1266 family iron-only hydrogenase system putative regulator [Candidatus Bruticola sp.]
MVNTRLAIVSVVLGQLSPIDKLNALLHQYSEYIIGRMGLPQRSRGINLISIAMDAPNDAINALSGKIGRLIDTKVKVLYA